MIWTYALVGVLFVIFVARAVKNQISELFLFGGLFSFVETYRFWGVDYLKFPSLPEVVYIVVASALLFWSFMKVLSVIGKWYKPAKRLHDIVMG